MNSRLALIGAVLAGVAVVGFQASRGGFIAPADTPPEGATAAADPAPETAAQTPADDLPPDALARADAERVGLEEALATAEAEAARLQAELDARDTADAAALASGETDLVAALAERDAELARLNVALLEQSSEIDRLSTELAARDTELAGLIDQSQKLADLAIPVMMAPARPPETALDAQIAAAKGVPLPRPGATPLPAARPAPRPLAEVHFDMGSATLSPGAATRAQLAAAALADMDLAKIRLTGHSDTVGSSAANQTLSRARAEAVANVLVAAGVPREKIEVVAFGQEADVLPVPTGAGVPEPLNRCVGIWPIAAEI